MEGGDNCPTYRVALFVSESAQTVHAGTALCKKVLAATFRTSPKSLFSSSPSERNLAGWVMLLLENVYLFRELEIYFSFASAGNGKD